MNCSRNEGTTRRITSLTIEMDRAQSAFFGSWHIKLMVNFAEPRRRIAQYVDINDVCNGRAFQPQWAFALTKPALQIAHNYRRAPNPQAFLTTPLCNICVLISGAHVGERSQRSRFAARETSREHTVRQFRRFG